MGIFIWLLSSTINSFAIEQSITISSKAAIIETLNDKTAIEYRNNVCIQLDKNQEIFGRRAVTLAAKNKQPRYVLIEQPIAKTPQNLLRAEKFFIDTQTKRIHAQIHARLQHKTVAGRYTISANNIILWPNNMHCVAHRSQERPVITHIALAKGQSNNERHSCPSATGSTKNCCR